jgi:hypothetical protein
MGPAIRRFLVLIAVTFLALMFVPIASADSLSLSTTPAQGYNVFAGIYTGPYAGTINGQSVLIVCDDFLHDTNAGQSWTATANQFSSLGQPGVLTMWNSTTDPNYMVHYQEAAYLTLIMLATPNTAANAATIGELSFAIWSIFAPSQVTAWLNSYGASLPSGFITGVNNDITLAQNNYSTGNYSNFTLYTPPCVGTSCGGPQEFLYVQVPEGGTAAVYLMGALLACFGAMFLRPRLQTQ